MKSQIQDTAKTWEKMLYVDGGKLELSKCYWILIVWKWINGIAYLANENEASAELQIIKSEQKERVVIRRMSTTGAPKALGCHVAADGNWPKELGLWTAESVRFSNKVKKAQFHRSCGAMVYPMTRIPKIRFVAPLIGLKR